MQQRQKRKWSPYRPRECVENLTSGNIEKIKQLEYENEALHATMGAAKEYYANVCKELDDEFMGMKQRHEKELQVMKMNTSAITTIYEEKRIKKIYKDEIEYLNHELSRAKDKLEVANNNFLAIQQETNLKQHKLKKENRL